MWYSGNDRGQVHHPTCGEHDECDEVHTRLTGVSLHRVRPRPAGPMGRLAHRSHRRAGIANQSVHDGSSVSVLPAALLGVRCIAVRHRGGWRTRDVFRHRRVHPWQSLALFLPGTIESGAVRGAQYIQFNIYGASTRNPFSLWQATWTTDDFTPRHVALHTENTPHFTVHTNMYLNWPDVDLVQTGQFRHCSAVIQVIPAPGGAALLLAASCAVLLRRRRRMSPRT